MAESMMKRVSSWGRSLSKRKGADDSRKWELDSVRN